jgi:hypothetical protein
MARPTLNINRSRLLSWAFVIQLWTPLVIGGSPTLGGLVWVALSLTLFVIPGFVLFRTKLTLNHFGIIIISTFLIPSIIIGISNIVNYKSDARSTIDILRTLYFSAPFTLGIMISRNSKVCEEFIAKTINISLLSFIIYVILSYVIRNSIDNFELYYGKFDNVVSLRTFAPFANPYDLALVSVFFLLYYLSRFRLAPAYASLFLIATTQSRTGVILAIAGVLASIFSNGRLRRQTLTFGASLLLFASIAFMTIISWDDVKSLYIIANTTGLFDGSSTTLTKRYMQWENLNDLPLLGWGAITSDRIVIENGFIYEIYRCGLLGAYNIFFFYVTPSLVAAYFIIINNKNSAIFPISVFVILTLIGSWSNVFIYQPKISLIYWLLVGILYGSALKRELHPETPQPTRLAV